MPKVFMPSDNYERFLPTLAKRYEKTFNPFRLKVRIHLGIDADDPINRGTTPDYNDCFFNCAGQRPNYLDLFATAGGLPEVHSGGHGLAFHRRVVSLRDNSGISGKFPQVVGKPT